MRVLVADDHGLVRDSLKQYVLLLDNVVHVNEAQSLSDVLALSGSGLSAPDLSTSDNPIDMILLDLHMPGMSGASSVAVVRQHFPAARIVVVSGIVDKQVIADALRNGANGYIAKTTYGAALVNALRLVLVGETYIPPALFDDAKTEKQTLFPSTVATKLSPREAEVLEKLVSGDNNRAIAAGLGLQDATVKVHIRNIYRKIGAANRSDAIDIILKSGGVEAWTASE